MTLYFQNDSFLEIKDDEKCKGKHMKLEHGTPYTIFDKQVFVDGVRNGTIDVTKVPTIGQVRCRYTPINPTRCFCLSSRVQFMIWYECKEGSGYVTENF